MSKLVVLDDRRPPPPRPNIRPSRFTHLVPLADGRSVVFNALSGDLALWDPAQAAAYKRIGAGDHTAADDAFIEQLRRTRHVGEKAVDEREVVRAAYDRERYGEPVMTLTSFVRGAEGAAPQAPMAAPVRAAVTGLCDKMAGSLKGINALWAGHEPLEALFAVGDLSLRLAEISANRRLRYAGAVQTDGVALTPVVAEKLPGLEIRHVEVRIRTGGGVLDTLGRVIENLRAAVDMGQLQIHLRLEAAPERPAVAIEVLERLAGAGLAKARGLGIDLEGGVFQSCHRHFGLAASGNDGTAIVERAHRLGFTMTPVLPKFLSQCQAVRSLSYAVAPNGDLHKCWATVASPEARLGTASAPATSQVSLVRQPRWMVMDPFSDAVCSECSILPLCSGHCADLYPTKTAVAAGELNRPCPQLKQELGGRVLAAAGITGMIDLRGASNG